MKFLKDILKKFVKENPKPLGRWNIEYCNTKINQKIDLSNEDHCGPCGQYLLEKIELKNNDKNEKNNNKNIIKENIEK